MALPPDSSRESNPEVDSSPSATSDREERIKTLLRNTAGDGEGETKADSAEDQLAPYDRAVGRVHGRMLAAAAMSYWRTLLVTFLGLGLVSASLWRTLSHWAIPNFAVTLSPWYFAGGAVLIASLAVGIALFVRRPSRHQAAVEIDRRLGLEERIGTWHSLTPQQRLQPAGVALSHDLVRRVKQIEPARVVPFSVSPKWWIPIVLLTLYAGTDFLPSLQGGPEAPIDPQSQQRAVAETEVLSRKVEETIKENPLLAENLSEVKNSLDDLKRDLQSKPEMSPRDAALRLSDLSKELDQKRKQLESADKVRKSLSKLAANKADSGLEKSLQEGDLDKARKTLSRLRKKVQDNSLDQKERDDLASEMDQLQKQLSDLSKLERRSQQLQQSMPKDMLDDQMEKLAGDSQQLEQMRQLAEQFSKAAQAARGQQQQGGEPSQEDLQQLNDALSQAEEILKEIGEQAEAMEELEKMMQQLQQAREGMAQMQEGEESEMTLSGGDEGEGDGQGMDSISEAGQIMIPGRGGKKAGRGPGREGKQEEDLTNAPAADLNIKGNTGAGPSKVIGKGEKVSVAGVSTLSSEPSQTARAELIDDAISRQKIPREYREHTKEYFELLNQGDVSTKRTEPEPAAP